MNNKVITLIKQNSGTILSFGAFGGAVTGSVLAYKAGYRAREMEFEYEDEKALKSAKKRLIWPVLGALTATGALITGADILNRKQKSDLMAIAMAGGSALNSYRQEVIKRYGAEVDADICDTVASSSMHCAPHPEIPDKFVQWVFDPCVDGLPVVVFEAYERDVINAEKHFNRNYILKSIANVSELLGFLGVEMRENDEDFDKYGWAINDSEIYFVDFEHIKQADGSFLIHPIFAPWFDPGNLDMFGEEY